MAQSINSNFTQCPAGRREALGGWHRNWTPPGCRFEKWVQASQVSYLRSQEDQDESSRLTKKMRHINQAQPCLGYRFYLLNPTFNQQDTLVYINECKQLLEGHDLCRGTASMQTTAALNSDQQLPTQSQNGAKKKNNVITVPNGINFEIATTNWGGQIEPFNP